MVCIKKYTVAFEWDSLKPPTIATAALAVLLDTGGCNFRKQNVFSDANFIQYRRENLSSYIHNFLLSFG